MTGSIGRSTSRTVALIVASGTVALAATLDPVGISGATAAIDRPDVLLIITDDQRADTMRYMPATRRRLPTAFVNAVASNPSCCPSRTSIMTGSYSHTNGMWTNGQGPDGSLQEAFGGWLRYAELDLDRRSIAFELQRNGYRTAHLGKFLNRFDPASLPDVPEGWDMFLGLLGSDELTPGSLGPYYGYTLIGQVDGAFVSDVHGSDPSDHSTRVLADEAVSFIRSAGEEPLFLQLSFPAPHGRAGGLPPVPQVRDADAPVDLSRASPAVNEANVDDKPRYIRIRSPISARWLRRWRITTARVLYGVDRALGRVLAAQDVRDPGLENTLVIFMSDNGFATGEHRWMTKGVPYEGAIRIPLRVSWPGLASGPIGAVVANLDVAPTIAQVTGVPFDTPDAVSLLDPSRHLVVLEGLAEERSFCGVRTGSRKFVTYATGEREFYNLRRDPFELVNRPRSDAASRLSAVARDACTGNLPPGWTARVGY